PSRISRSRPPSHPRELVNEPITAIYSAAGRYVAADVRHSAGGHCSVHAVAGIGLARSGIPDYPGDDVLPRGQPERDGHYGDSASGTAVRPNAGAEPDDLDQFGRGLGD